MIRVRIFSLVLALFCLSGLALGAAAAQVDCDAVYCFTGQDFSEDAETLSGICVTGLPEASAGTVLLGNRVIRPGDILTSDQLQQLPFARTQLRLYFYRFLFHASHLPLPFKLTDFAEKKKRMLCKHPFVAYKNKNGSLHYRFLSIGKLNLYHIG